MQAKRSAWIENISDANAEHQIYLDESGINTNLTRHYARAVHGKCAIDAAPINTPAGIHRFVVHVFTKPLCGCSALVRSIYQTAVKTNGRQNGVFLQACLLGQHQWHISHVPYTALWKNVHALAVMRPERS